MPLPYESNGLKFSVYTLFEKAYNLRNTCLQQISIYHAETNYLRPE